MWCQKNQTDAGLFVVVFVVELFYHFNYLLATIVAFSSDVVPKMYFTSDRITHLRGNRWTGNGSLTLRGTTSPVQLDTHYLGQRSWNGTRAACVCKTELRREDYAVNWQQILNKGIAVVGPTVQIELDVQVVQDE